MEEFWLHFIGSPSTKFLEYIDYSIQLNTTNSIDSDLYRAVLSRAPYNPTVQRPSLKNRSTKSIYIPWYELTKTNSRWSRSQPNWSWLVCVWVSKALFQIEKMLFFDDPTEALYFSLVCPKIKWTLYVFCPLRWFRAGTDTSTNKTLDVSLHCAYHKPSISCILREEKPATFKQLVNLLRLRI